MKNSTIQNDATDTILQLQMAVNALAVTNMPKDMNDIVFSDGCHSHYRIIQGFLTLYAFRDMKSAENFQAEK